MYFKLNVKKEQYIKRQPIRKPTSEEDQTTNIYKNGVYI